MQCFQGKSVYKGIAMGPIVVLKKNDYQVKRTRIEDTEAEVKRSKGRPPKISQRSERIILKLDEKTYKDLSIIKALNRLDIQDIVFAATVKFLKEYNTDSGLTDKGIELVKDIKDQYEK